MFCPNCGNQYQGTPRFCENCGLALGPRLAEPPTRPQFMDWFRTHLNWTLVIGFLLINGVSFIVGFLAGYYGVEEENFYAKVFWPSYIASIIATAIVAGWVLNQKGRSLLWLIFALLWFGWIVWLALGNKRQAAGQVR